METKNKNYRLQSVCRRLGFHSSFYVEPVGLSGGLALWWTSEISLSVVSASNNLIHSQVSVANNVPPWECSFVYGSPSREGKQKVWDSMKSLGQSVRMPWLCIGDFNQVLSCGDKFGGNLPDSQMIMAFHEMLDSCGLVDLEYKGPRFTWRNNRTQGDLIMERLDMAFANAAWREEHDKAVVVVEAAVGSDHNPLLLDTSFTQNKVRKSFRFESFWVTESGCKEVVKEAWSKPCGGSKMEMVCRKLRGCKKRLKEWHKTQFGDLRLKIAAAKEELLDVQCKMGQGFNEELVHVERVIISKLEDLWQKEAMYWHQRSRINWLQMGDRNTRFFHLTTIQRRQRNQIIKLRDEHGDWQSGEQQISGIIQSHFYGLYSPPPNRDFQEILDIVEPVISIDMNESLTRPLTIDEVRIATFQMGPLKAPGSDGFPGLFFQSYWDIVGQNIFEAASSFFQGNPMLPEMNHTNVVLIPKVQSPECMSQLRPISLCRFIYKIISKVLANRLQPFIGQIISEEQSAFIQGRQIQDNIIVAHEVFHFLKYRKSGCKEYMAIKLDLNKAYDRVCWDFLLKTLDRMGFHPVWIEWIKQCICGVKYSIVANGRQICNVLPRRGLRQGDPLSPYLFLIVADVFSQVIRKAIEDGYLRGIKMKPRCPIVSHLLFADDALIFLEADKNLCTNFSLIAHQFGEASGLTINVHKSSVFFSTNTAGDHRTEILQLLGMKEMEQHSKYLGLPVFWGRSKKEALSYIKDRILGKIHGWSGKELNQASKEILIKSVLQPMVLFPFMCGKAPNSFCSKLNSIISSFWWGRGCTSRGIHWGTWNKVSANKGIGGLGFKDFACFNIALLAKQFWRLHENPDALWARVLKGVYFPTTDCWRGKKGGSPSWFWTSLLEGRKLMQNHVRWNVGSGEIIKFWSDAWIPNLPGGKVLSHAPAGYQESLVSDFLTDSKDSWDMEKLRACVSEEEVRLISSIPISTARAPDKIIWSCSKSGKYSTKLGYHQAHAIASEKTPVPPSSSFIEPKSMWNKLWKIPTMPKVKHFMWRAVHNWIACKANLHKRKCAISPICPMCFREAETVEHTLFRCPWTKAVWEGSGKHHWVLDKEIHAVNKWMVDLLCGDLAKETTLERVGEIFQTCWAIWLGRNEYVFNGKRPIPEDCIWKASKANSDYLHAVFKSVTDRNHPTLHRPKWDPPPVGAFKFNCDGSFVSSHSKATFGIIARDNGANVMWWYSGHIRATSALFVEAWALRIACKAAWENLDNDTKIFFETDCLELCNYVNQGLSDQSWEIYAIIEDIRTWKRSRQWSFNWCCRSNNRAAHWLAHNRRDRFMWSTTGSIPVELSCILRTDSLPEG